MIRSRSAIRLLPRAFLPAWVLLSILLPGLPGQAQEPGLGDDTPLIEAIPVNAEEKEWLREHPRIRVYFEPWPPFLVEDESRIPGGITVGYLEMIAGALGIELEYVRIPWTQALVDIREHRIDLLPILTHLPEREGSMIFTRDYLSFPIVIFSQKDSFFISDFGDIIHKNVVVEKDYAMHERLKKALPKANLQVVKTTAEALEAVATGRADAYVGNLAVGSYLIQKLGFSNLKVAAPAPFGTHDQAMAVRSDWPILADLLEKGLEAITWKGHQSIRQRWLWVRYEHGISSADVWRWILRIVGGAAILLVLALLWSLMLKREVKKAEAQLVHAGKLAILGELGAGIAHELNQPITAIRGFAELILSNKDELDPEASDLIDRIYNATYRMSYIVDNVRSFARQSSFQPDPNDALQPLVAAVDLIAEQLKLHGIKVERDFAEDLPEALCDSNQLQQVFLNLLGNSRDAVDTLPTGRKKRIRIKVQGNGSSIVYMVEDNGPGVPEKIRSRIFEPFFTTKPEGRGMGIGLSLSSRIVKNHGGKISCEPLPEGGTRFVISIPSAASKS